MRPDSDSPVGIAAGGRPRDEAKATALALNLQDDAFRLGSHEIKRRNKLFASYSLDPFECYSKGNVNLVLNCRTGTQPHVFDLLFRRVPPAVTDLAVAGDRGTPDTQIASHGGRSHWDDKAMRIGIPYLVHGPENVIPSLVWLEANQDRVDFRWVAGKSFAAQLTLNASGILGEGESGFLGIPAYNSDGAGVDGMVQSIPQVSSRVLDDVGDLRRKVGPCYSDAINILLRYRVEVSRLGATLVPRVIGNEIIGRFNLIACVADELLGAREGVGHDIRS